MTHVIHRNLRSEVPTAVAGEGPYIIDSTGKRYLDGSGGAAVSCLGHSDREVTDAITAQLERIPYAHTGFFTTEPVEELADFLASKAPQGLGNCYFVSGGSEAIESALKMARQYFVERGETWRRHIIARRQSYHGNTLAALAAGGNMWRREPYLPLLIETHHISPCYEYRGKLADESQAEYGLRVADELEAKIEELGPSSVMAFIAEPVVGATLGAVPAVPGYFKRIREICDRHGVLLILDEVMCGMGRCGTRFAFEHEGIVPDIVCMAKGLGGGYQPIGAMLVQDRLVEAIREGTGFFQHGYTYIGHAAACAGALAVQRVIEKRDLLRRVNLLGKELKARLEALLGNHPYVGDIRGRGLFIGIELVRDRMTKEPFDPALAINGKIKAAAMEQGLMCYPMGGTIDGRRGDHIIISPPYIIEDRHIDEIIDKLSAAFDRALPAA
ncbi:MAG: aspartate aminotransferase family protein [Hyphomicrobiales bacterium]